MSVVKNYFMIERKARLNQLIDMIKEHPNLHFNKIKGLFILKTGAKGKTVDDYIRELESAGLIEWSNDGLFLKALL